MIVCRHKVSNRLVQVYGDFESFFTSPDYLYYVTNCNNYYRDKLTDDEYEMAKGNRII